MSQIKASRRIRSFRRAMFVLIALTIAIVGYIYIRSQREQLPTVRVASVSNKDIASFLNVTATLEPGRVSTPTVSGQTVEAVFVKAGDQVKAGDVLVTFNLDELEKQYEEASELKAKAESAAADAQNLIQRQASEASAKSTQLQKDINSLSSTIGKITASIDTLISTMPVQLEISPDLAMQLKPLLEAFDPKAENAREQLDAITTLIQSGITVSANPDHEAAKKSIDKNTARIGSLFSDITGGLVDVAGTALGSSAMSQASSMITQAQTAISTAAQAETLAREALENARLDIRAEFDGLVVSVNASPGDTVGSAGTSALNSSLGGMLGASFGDASALSGSLSTAQPVLVLYDNVNPKAVFRANRIDSTRLKTGMPVTYEQDGKTFFGEITYKAKIATTGSSLGSSSSSTSGMFGGQDLTSIGEPMLDVEMSIRGQSEDDLILGFTIDAKIQTDSASNVPCVPAEALKRELGEYFVYVVKADNTLEKRFMTPGIQSDMDAQVLEGLQIGERVVLNPSNSLVEGMEVVVSGGENP